MVKDLLNEVETDDLRELFADLVIKAMVADAMDIDGSEEYQLILGIAVVAIDEEISRRREEM